MSASSSVIICTMIHYNKLIRDKVPELKAEEGKRISYHPAGSDEEYRYLLLQKLQAEINKFRDRVAVGDLAETLEILDAMRELHKLDASEVEAFKENQFIERGGYTKRLVLDSSEEEIGHRQEQEL